MEYLIEKSNCFSSSFFGTKVSQQSEFRAGVLHIAKYSNDVKAVCKMSHVIYEILFKPKMQI